MITNSLKNLVASAVALALSPSAFAEGFLTPQKPYLTPVGASDFTFHPLITAGETVPLTGGAPGSLYQLVGIPDGMGAYKLKSKKSTHVVLYCNHEFTQTAASQPQIGGPTYRGALVSKFILDQKTGGVISGAPAYSKVFQDDTLVGDIQTSLNPTIPPFGRFCSGALAWKEAGFDRPIYFANEEWDTAGVPAPLRFNQKGAQSVAVFDNDEGVGEAHALSYLGFFAWENSPIMPRNDHYTVIMGMEDGPARLDNQLYMYVGRKDRSRGATILEKNGLVGGKLYVFRSTTPGLTSEGNYTTPGVSVQGEWVEIPNANYLSDTQLEAASDAIGAFTFVRPEDGSFDKNQKRQNKDYYFVTTGSSEGGENELGRLYTLSWSNPTNPLSPATLKMVYNADALAAVGTDIALSPDNIDSSKTRLMIQEDGTTESRAKMTSLGRDGSIWSFSMPPTAASAKRQAELDPPAPVPHNQAVTAGVWESSGIIDASAWFGADTWLVNVQAHRPTTSPIGTVENGQLLLMKPLNKPSGDDDDRDDDDDDRDDDDDDDRGDDRD